MYARLISAMVLSVAFSASALAQFSGPSKSGSHTTVTQAAGNLRVGTYVTLTGNVIEHLREEYFTFRDKTGSMRVEIPDRVFRGKRVEPSTTVRITGEIDVGRAGRYVYVNALEVVSP